MATKAGYVIYDETIDNIINEEVSKSKDNLSEAFRNAEKRISEETDQAVTKAKISSRYYNKLKPDRSKSTEKKFVSSSSGSPVEDTSNYLNELAIDIVNKMPKKDKINFIRALIREL